MFRPSVGTKPGQLTERRRRERLISVSIFAVCTLVMAVGISFLSHHSAVTIAKVQVAGVEREAPDTVRNAALAVLSEDSFQLFSRSNMLFYPRIEMVKAVATTFPRFNDVRVSRTSLFEPELIIEVQEREPFALWCRRGEGAATTTTPYGGNEDIEDHMLGGSDACFVLDESGFVYGTAEVEDKELGLLVVRGGLTEPKIGSYFSPAHFAGLKNILEGLPRLQAKSSAFVPTLLAILGDHDYEITLQGGLRIRAAFAQSGEEVIGNLRTALTSDTLRGREHEVEYIDLRFGNRVYYKFEETEEE